MHKGRDWFAAINRAETWVRHATRKLPFLQRVQNLCLIINRNSPISSRKSVPFARLLPFARFPSMRAPRNLPADAYPKISSSNSSLGIASAIDLD